MKNQNKQWYLAGGIYFDKSDPRVVVPKKYGIGNTLNFGQVATKRGILFVALVAAGVALYFASRY
ncbi:DUF5808 domain-containing protein [Paenibacillus sp. CAU 1782]